MEEAVKALVAALSPEDVEAICNLDPASMHHGLGRHIRNSWSFWEWDTPIRNDCMEKYAITHPDDMSGLLLAWVAATVRAEDFDPVAYCNRFHEHWAQYGMTSVEAGTPEGK